MKKYRFYISIFLATLIVGFFIYFLSDTSLIVKTIYSLMSEEDKNKIISSLIDRVDSDTMKYKFELALKKFSTKIENHEYSDENLKSLLEDFENISNLSKIDSVTIENFYQKINRNF